LQVKDLFIELEQLTNVNENANDNNQHQYEWNEVSRWIKYEQNLRLDSNVWSKPFVGALIYQSLLYLKTGLQYGTVLLNSDFESSDLLMDEIIQDFIDSGHMNKENKEQIKNILLSPHRHTHTISNSASRKSMISDMLNSASTSRRTSNEQEIIESRKNSLISESRIKNNKSFKSNMNEIDIESKVILK